jgi:hypothetical protein
MQLFSGLERRGQPIAPRFLFARRLLINFALGLSLIFVSLIAGMACYHVLEGLGWVRAFSHAAMILGGMGPYDEPASEAGQLFEGAYAIYCGLLLIGVTGLILAPVFHRVMHAFHLPDDDGTTRSSSEAVAHQKSRSSSEAVAHKRGSAKKSTKR